MIAEEARTALTSRSKLWKVDDRFYWTQWATAAAFMASAGSVCLAYEMTGNPLYAAYARELVQGTFLRQANRVRRFADFRFTWICFGSVIPALLRTVAQAMNKDPEGLERADREWREKRAQLGRPIYSGPGVDSDKDAMDANGNIISRPPENLPCQAPPRLREPVANLGRISTEDCGPVLRELLGKRGDGA
jgi:hypothetical protein